MQSVGEEEGKPFIWVSEVVRSVTVKQGKLPVVGKAHRIMKSFRSVPNIHSNDVRREELMVWNVIYNFG